MTTPSDCAPRVPTRRSAEPARSKHRPGRPTGCGSTAAATARPTPRSTGSPCPGCAGTLAPDYLQRRLADGKTRREAIRCLKRYIAREIYTLIKPQTIVQTCTVHLLRAAMRFVSYQDRKRVAAALRPIYTAPTDEAARLELDAFAGAPVGPPLPGGGDGLGERVGADHRSSSGSRPSSAGSSTRRTRSSR
ncbi:hypothetical protein GCM10023320_40650 [Pseudonocardia adelaidensis]|uniref:Mutator family transposase n=1 Tax=Pseudonocardia adelaidensis TaxID=648754 RepID=A0ABP9NLB3_9PSEU